MMEGLEPDSLSMCVLQCKCCYICGSLLMDYVCLLQLWWYSILCEFRIDKRVMFHVCTCEYCSMRVVATIKYMTCAIHATGKRGPRKHVTRKLSVDTCKMKL